jgi:hypothetical protein
MITLFFILIKKNEFISKKKLKKKEQNPQEIPWGIPADFPRNVKFAGNYFLGSNPQENPWEYLRIFLKTQNPQEITS